MSNEVSGKQRRWLRPAAVLVVVASLGGASISGAPNVQAATPSAAAAPIPGWPGGFPAYKGRYHLTSSSDSAFAKSGELTIFSRFVPHQSKPQMSGILSLYTTDGTNVVYLSHFVHTGTKLSAQVNLGIYTGPKIGTFAVVSFKAMEMVVNYVPVQGATIVLHFSRFSTNPHP